MATALSRGKGVGTVADEMEQEREDSSWLSSWVEMNFKQGRVGKRFLKMVKTWNRAGSVSHDDGNH